MTRAMTGGRGVSAGWLGAALAVACAACGGDLEVKVDAHVGPDAAIPDAAAVDAAPAVDAQPATDASPPDAGPMLEGIIVAPQSAVISSPLQMTATALLDDGGSFDITGTAEWTSDTPGLMTVSATGLVELTPCIRVGGTAVISASYAGFEDGADITAIVDSFLQVRVRPDAPAPVATGDTIELSGQGVYGDATIVDITELDAVTWTTSDESVASVSNEAGTRGVVTGVAPGTADIGLSWDETDGACAALVADPVTVTVVAP